MMIENTKCECGHQNAVGTVLCESCGKPLEDDGGHAPLEMRYDGVARLSQRTNPTLINRVWNFFSSVKVAVWLIIITLIGASLGTIFTQENMLVNVDPSTYYKQTYGTLGHIYYLLGLSHTYNSWWFILLLVMIGTSLIICSLDRVLPLYRALSKQQIKKHLLFINRQKVHFAAELPETHSNHSEQWIAELAVILRKRWYKVHTDGAALLAEKHRFSRWGPYINHTGLIIILLAGLALTIPALQSEEYIGILEGETVRVPNTNYYVKNEQFTVDIYTEEELAKMYADPNKLVPKLFETKAVLYECTSDCDVPGKEPQLTELVRHDIVVNKPLTYKSLKFYQSDYAETPQLRSVTPSLRNKETGQAYGKLTLSMKNPAPTYTVGPYTLDLISYFPEFALDENKQPITRSANPLAPAFIFNITGHDLPKEGLRYIYFPRPADKEMFGEEQINSLVGSPLELSVESMATDVEIALYTSFLNVSKNLALPYFWIGCAIFLIGLSMGLYWHHRRIWVRIDDNMISLGAHTNKNWYGLRQDVAVALSRMGIEIDPKALENGVNRS
jgi:cytochrome c biogenesis protein